MEAILDNISEFVLCLFCWENWRILGDSLVMNPLFKWFIILGIIFLVVRCYSKKHANVLRIYTTDRGFIFMKKSALKNVVKKICHEVLPQSRSRVKICACYRKINLREYLCLQCP
ncbi:MAG: hypothetical protein LBS71_00775 [Puniceicoccales bacterium]|jgi:1-acyl-sn-glycerol-3-phosphate acyltransferase|nr:hypothetical protein [Puniceicoccales bacterium]